MPRFSPAEIGKRNRAIDEEMGVFLGRYSRQDKRRPMNLDEFDWDKIRPDQIDESLLDALHFSTLIESNPRYPAERFFEAADRSNVMWPAVFIKEIWLPEESMHHAPFREYLIRSGKLEKDFIDSEITKVRSREFKIGYGYSALEAGTYGWIQELLTWQFYEAMRSYLQTSRRMYKDPVLGKILERISEQENFHKHTYLTGMKTTLKHRPDLKWEVVKSLIKFSMPHVTMLPNIPKDSAGRLSKKIEYNTQKVIDEIARVTLELTSYWGVGRSVIGYGATHGMPFKSNILMAILEPFSRVSWSPVNYGVGRLAINLYRR